MAVYVYCCIFQSNLIGSFCLVLHCYALLSSCQLPCCNLFTLHAMFVYLRRAPLVNYGPRSNLTIDTSSTITVYLLQTIITFHTIQLILCYSKLVSLKTSL